MFGVNKTTLNIIATGCVGVFVGYCIYFDHQRRSDPDYKKKVHLRRQRLREKLLQKSDKQAPSPSTIPPHFKNEETYRYFLQEIHLGEQEIAKRNVINGVEHLARAVTVCNQPQQLLLLMQQTLPPQGFLLLMQKVQALTLARLERSANA